MRKFKNFFLLFLIVLSATCTLAQAISPGTLYFDYWKKGVRTITINVSPDVKWSIAKYPYWLEFDKVFGEGSAIVNVTCIEENTSCDYERKGIIIIKILNDTIPDFNVFVQQKPKSPYLYVSTTEIEVDSKKTYASMDFVSRCYWSVSMDSWLSLFTESGDEISDSNDGIGSSRIDIDANTSDKERVGLIVFVSGTESDTVKVIQEAQESVITEVIDGSNVANLAYPNPTSGIIYLRESVNKVIIFDVLGSIIDTIELKETKQIDLSTYTSEVFLIQAITNDKSQFVKMNME